MKLLKYIAPQKLIVNGDVSPCECTDTITCAYCVQANILAMEKKFKADEQSAEAFIIKARQFGLRKTARLLGVTDGAIRLWIKSGNIPMEKVNKFVGVRS